MVDDRYFASGWILHLRVPPLRRQSRRWQVPELSLTLNAHQTLDGYTFLYKNYLVCILKLMGFKLLIAVLVLTLSVANFVLASMCAAYCLSSGPHHHMESQSSPTVGGHHFHSHHHAANCAECPPDSANSLNQKVDCANLVQIEALKESSFSLDA